MQFDRIIKGGELVSPHDRLRGDVGIKDGRIAAIGDLDVADARAVYDASGRLVFPGFIDEHVHSREPGLEHKEDFAHSTRGAAASGITTVVEMPNSVPPVSDSASFSSRATLLEANAFVDFALWGMVLGETNIDHLAEMADAGVVGFKLFWGYALDRRTLALVYDPGPGQDVIPPPDDGTILEAFEVIAGTGRPVAIHAENAEVIGRLTRRERGSGASDYASLLRSRPAYAEAMTIDAGIRLAAATGAHLHVVHVSSIEGAERIAQARSAGSRVTGETCPHYLFLSSDDYARCGNEMKIFPPIRGPEHRDGLWSALRTGTLKTLGSDHAPHTPSEKSADIWRAPAGAAVIQATVPLMLDAAHAGKVSYESLAALLSENPARLLGLYGRKGVLAAGADADITVVDPERSHTLDRDALLSKSKVMPYHGWEVQGMAVAAFVRGVQVMEDGRLVDGDTARGRLVRPVGPTTLT